MKLKFKLSLLMIAIVVIAIGVTAIIVLSNASDIAEELSLRGLEDLGSWRAEYWKGREDGYMQILRTLSSLMERARYVQTGSYKLGVREIIITSFPAARACFAALETPPAKIAAPFIIRSSVMIRPWKPI